MGYLRSRYLFVFVLILLGYSHANSQQGNIWYFGFNAGLNFNTTPPQPLTNGALNTQEGCASICDKRGNLLFYTNGVTVYNRNHTAMPNGAGLLGDNSSTQSAIIIPNPGDTNLYYIFTADCLENLFAKGYNYSVVDMRLNGGLGDVTAQKNVFLYGPSTERLTAVKAANGIDYWVITKGFNNNRYTVYKVDCNGINPVPVISDVGVPHTHSSPEFTGAGALKASPDGKKVCVAITWPVAMAELFDFNNNTGILSNPIDLLGYNAGYVFIYGVEFSPNSKLLYVTTGLDRTINQYDITSGNQATIEASKFVMNTAPFYPAALQIAPDKKIYLASNLSPTISVINNPDVPGAGCNLALGAINLGGQQSATGLPAYIASFFDASNHIDFTSAFVDCHVQFSGTTDLSGSLLWEWDFGDGATGLGQVVNHSYRQIGTYNVTLKVKSSSAACSFITTDSFTISHPVTINNVFAVDFTKTGNCFGDVYQFFDNTVLTIGAITGYTWDFGDGSPVVTNQNASHTYAATGVYDVKLLISTSGVCRADSIIKKVYVETRPTAAFTPADGCINNPILFTDASTNTVGAVGAWNWDFGDGGSSTQQNPTHAYTATGPYNVTLSVASAHGCLSASVSHPLRIYDIPIADYTVAIPCIGQGTVFTDVSPNTNGNIIAWQWDFGDGGSSSAASPVHIYNSTGIFPSSLRVQSQYGCFSALKNIPVSIGRATAFAGNDTTAIFDVPLQLQATGGIGYVWSPSTGLNNPLIPNPVAILRSDITYTVTVTDVNGCTATDDVFVKVYANNDVHVPGAFTPNGDGINDILKPLGFGLKKIEYFLIYNRYGQLVFETHQLDKGWDGTFKGKEQPTGTYTFVVKAINYRNRAVEKTGTSILIR